MNKAVCRLTYQDVVWLDICMEDIASFKEFQSQEQLLTIGPDSLNMKANILTVFFNTSRKFILLGKKQKSS